MQKSEKTVRGADVLEKRQCSNEKGKDFPILVLLLLFFAFVLDVPSPRNGISQTSKS